MRPPMTDDSDVQEMWRDKFRDAPLDDDEAEERADAAVVVARQQAAMSKPGLPFDEMTIRSAARGARVEHHVDPVIPVDVDLDLLADVGEPAKEMFYNGIQLPSEETDEVVQQDGHVGEIIVESMFGNSTAAPVIGAPLVREHVADNSTEDSEGSNNDEPDAEDMSQRQSASTATGQSDAPTVRSSGRSKRATDKYKA